MELRFSKIFIAFLFICVRESWVEDGPMPVQAMHSGTQRWAAKPATYATSTDPFKGGNILPISSRLRFNMELRG